MMLFWMNSQTRSIDAASSAETGFLRELTGTDGNIRP
jgi:hypothetical protein